MEKYKKWIKYKILSGIVIGLVLNLIGIFLIRFVTVVGFGQKSLQNFISNENPAHYYTSLFIAFIVIIVFHAIHFYKVIQENKISGFRNKSIIRFRQYKEKYKQVKVSITSSFYF